MEDEPKKQIRSRRSWKGRGVGLQRTYVIMYSTVRCKYPPGCVRVWRPMTGEKKIEQHPANQDIE